MKKPILLLLCLGAVFLGTWFLLSLPRQEVVDLTLTGYRFSPEGEDRPCTLEIQGSYTSHRFSPEKDTFSPGYDGGFWLDGKKLSLMHVGFPGGSPLHSGKSAGNTNENPNLSNCLKQEKIPGKRCFPGIFIYFQSPSGYSPCSVKAFREATTRGLSAA